MSKSSKGCVTIGETEAFLIGHPDNGLGNTGKLPVARKILQYLKHLQDLPVTSGWPVKTLVCCPLARTTTSASCSGPAGCRSLPGRSKCVVAALCEYWNKSGIPRMSDQSISKKVIKLFEEWKLLQKHRNRTTTLELAKREKFMEKLDTLFDIASPDAVKILSSDRLRSAEARQADIDFYIDQQGARIGTMSGLDKVHHEAIEKKKKRHESELRKERASSSAIADKNIVAHSEMEEIEDDLNELDVDFVVP